MNTNFPDVSTPSFETPPRPLAEDVLQSAQDAVRTNPGAVDTLQGRVAHADAMAEEISLTCSQKIAQRVALRPVQSALVALAGGALVAALVKHALQRRGP